MRIYPHLQDTGGFFIAVLHKIPDVHSQSTGKRHADAVDSPETSAVKKPKLEQLDLDVDAAGDEPSEADVDAAEVVKDEFQEEGVPRPTVDPEDFKKQQRGKKHRADGGGVIHFKENPFTFVSPDDPIIKACMYVARYLLPLPLLTHL